MVRGLFPVYTKNIELVESQFLKREFNLVLTEISSEIAFPTNSKFTIFATTKPSELQPFLNKAYPRSLVIFLLGNETYDIQTFEYLNKYKEKILHVFVHNLPKKTSFVVSLRCLLASIYDGGLLFSDDHNNIFRHFKNGIDCMKRNRKMELLYSASDFPYGYAGLFIEQLEHLKLVPVDCSPITNFKNNVKPNRDQQISFFGGSGSWSRRLAIENMKRLVPNCKIIFYENRYKAKDYSTFAKEISNSDYIMSLMRSRFILCPPGNLTNRSYRYLEALIMGALPVLPPATVQDNHHWGVWSEFIKPKYYSWTKSIKMALKMEDDERIFYVSKALEREIQKINKINEKLDKLLLFEK